MAFNCDGALSRRDLELLTRSVRRRASSELSEFDCNDVASEMTLDAFVAARDSEVPMGALIRKNETRARYFTRARKDVRRNRSAVDVLDIGASIPTAISDPQVFETCDRPVREGAQRSPGSAGIDMDPMNGIAVLDLMDRLPENERKAISLRECGYTFEEIGSLTKTSTGSAHRNYKSACESLRNAIKMADAA